jgi:hypothetical protein
MAAATTLGASSAPMLNRATSMARAEVTSRTVSAARADMPRAATAKLSAAKSIKTTYHHAIAPSWASMTPEIGD